MLTSIRLRNFKSFADAEAPLGPLTLLVGVNASGKSNVLDALRFLKGVASVGLPIDRLLQGQASGRGALWSGIRGGIHEVVRNGAGSFALETTWRGTSKGVKYVLEYALECAVAPAPIVCAESLRNNETSEVVFVGRLLSRDEGINSRRPEDMRLELKTSEKDDSREVPTVYQSLAILERFGRLSEESPKAKKEAAQAMSQALSALTFLDITPSLMRRYVPQEIAEIGETGEYLSAVLFQLCKDPEQKQSLVDWLTELCAPELADIDFSTTDEGEVMLRLIEKDGIRVSARSLSEGTLRFLGELVALRTAPEGSVILMEEIGNGLHPRRVHLLIEYLEAITEERNLQVIATTHSPLVLQALSPKARDDVVVLGRVPEKPGTILRRLADLPGFAEIVERRGMDYLFTTGWLEQAL